MHQHANSLLKFLIATVWIGLTACAASEGLTQTPLTSATSRPRITAEPSATQPPQVAPTFLEKPNEGGFRLVTYNVNWDSIFPADALAHELQFFDREQSFRRMMRAIEPDILCLQEINPERNSEDLSFFLDTVFGDDPQTWQTLLVRDTLIATRFNMISDGYAMNVSSEIPNLTQAAALIDLPDQEYGQADLYLICAHFKSGSEIADARMRQRQADVIMKGLRDAVTQGEDFDLAPGTPIVIAGDFNVYDTNAANHLAALSTGDIDNEALYGPDFSPDWDGTGFIDLLPSHNDLGKEFYTWRNDEEPFPPGILDHILYSDSELIILNSFILDTMQISSSGLQLYDLRASDVLLDPNTMNFDHLPLVADFSIANK